MIKLRTAFLLVLVLVSVSSFSANRYSICNGGNWTDANCWSATPGGAPCGCVPAAADDVFIQTNMNLNTHLTAGSGITGSLTIASGVSLATTIYNMEVKNGGVLTVNGTLEVNDLTFSNGSTVLVAPGGTLVVHGNFSNNNNSDQVTINGYLAIYGTAYNGNGADIGGTGGISTFGGDFTGGGTIASGITMDPLPIELIYFAGESTESGNKLSWITATEENNSFFTIERTLDGMNFEPVGIVAAGNNPLTEQSYSFEDYFISSVTYYRLKQTDINGTYTYSSLISVERNSSNSEMDVYPNPASQQINVIYESEEDAPVLVVVRDILGKEYYSKVILSGKGTTHFVIETENSLPAGIYTITASSDDKIFSHKLVVK